MNKTLYFWGHSGANLKACLSNFYYAPFWADNQKFLYSEQYFMYRKALLFDDNETAEKILKETDVKKIKKLGREVKNFDEEIWNAVKENFMFLACYNKFFFNPKLASYLLSTQNAELVEASPFDKVWGIGFDENSAEKNRDNWGENLLGKVLMKLRYSFSVGIAFNKNRDESAEYKLAWYLSSLSQKVQSKENKEFQQELNTYKLEYEKYFK